MVLAPLSEVVAFLAPPLCWGCRATVRSGAPLCPRCRRALHWLGPEPARVAGVEVWAPVAYDGPARDLVQALKFRSATRVADAMAAPIVAGAPAALSTPGATLVPVPLHPERRRQRGFDQAALLARALGRRTGLPVRRCLVRRGPAGSQVGRGRAERMDALDGVVVLTKDAPARPVLVDDVITTGATVAACSRVLGGAPAVAYARTPSR